jgi:hypothetical protein
VTPIVGQAGKLDLVALEVTGGVGVETPAGVKRLLT